jgi:hypothetical protein
MLHIGLNKKTGSKGRFFYGLKSDCSVSKLNLIETAAFRSVKLLKAKQLFTFSLPADAVRQDS